MATESTARAIATANISFGLVSIPVKLFSAGNSSAAVSFNMLHGKCGSRVKQQYVCPKEDNIVVPREEIRKGYEFAKDQYVLFSDEELKALEEQSTQTVEVTEFVPLSSIDPVYFDKAYYLGPDKGGSKAYWLFAEVLRATGRVALAKYAARGKQYLVMVRATDDGLVMQQLLYADEIRPISEVGLDKETPRDAELKLAKMLVDQASSDEFRPEAYEDEVKKRIQQQLKKKIDTGQEISAPPKPKSGEVIDLMEALRRSLAKGSKPARKAAAAAQRPAKRAGNGAEKKIASRK
ncbi:MAG TPA: Ku protein [Thermoanaerobaculia bacterium]|nr:Ku protein [Thermoanaerobaculia bacterium]